MSDEGKGPRGMEQAAAHWGEAFTSHRAAIQAYLRRRVPREDAEDLCQETFARAFAAGDALRDRGRTRAYLYRIAHNLLVNFRRRPRLVRTECDLGESVDLAALAIAPPQHGPEAETRWRALEARVDGLLAQLPPEHRLAFELGVLEQRPYAEIAAVMGWTPSKVKINVYRARQRLVAELTATPASPAARPRRARAGAD